MGIERDRLNEVPQGRSPWRRWGPYLSERAWGTVREDYSADGEAWDYFPHDHARSRAYRWSEDGLGGGLRRPAAALPGAGLLERARPDPEGADLRAHRPRGQPRRGRQGVLVVRRLDADPLVDALALPLSAGRVPLRRNSSTENAPRGRDEPEYELVDTGVFDDGPLLGDRGRLREGRPRGHLRPPRRPQRRARAGAAPRAADAVVPQHVVVGDRRSAPRSGLGDGALVAEDAAARQTAAGRDGSRRRRSSATTRRTRALFGGRVDALSEGRHQRPRGARRRRR